MLRLACLALVTSAVGRSDVPREDGSPDEACALLQVRAGKTHASESRNTAPGMKASFPWYHTLDEVKRVFENFTAHCQVELNVSQRSVGNASLSLEVLHISKRGVAPKVKAMLLYGIHAREVITVESALHFVGTLCGEGEEASRANKVLDEVSFVIVPVANPSGKHLVDEGNLCMRVNGRGVDLNRNFGDDHVENVGEGSKLGDETYHGPRGFSEAESLIIKSILEEERPDIYVSVHSGSYLLGTPFGYDGDKAPPTEEQLVKLLRPINEKYCKGGCKIGTLAQTVGYLNKGCDIDYVTEHVRIPVAFTWEIYRGEPNSGWAGAQLLQEGATGLASELDHRRKNAQCFKTFNPDTPQGASDVVKTWTGAYLELCEQYLTQHA